MKVQLRLTLNAPADEVWEAIRTPAVFTQVSSPLLNMTSEQPAGFPKRWLGDGPHTIGIRALGILPMGTQSIDVSFETRPDGTRIMTDAGKALSGSLTVIKEWRHRMAVTAREDNTTLYRDRLDVSAGLVTPLIWLSMWCFWQYRAVRLKQLARRRFAGLLSTPELPS